MRMKLQSITFMAAKKLNSMNKLRVEAARPPHSRRPHGSSSCHRRRPTRVQLVMEIRWWWSESRDFRVRDWRGGGGGEESRRSRHLFRVLEREKWTVGMNWETINRVEKSMMIKPNPIIYLIECIIVMMRKMSK